jgi:hypothetical protein
LLDLGGFAVAQGVVEIRGQLFARERRHVVIPSNELRVAGTIIADEPLCRENL